MAKQNPLNQFYSDKYEEQPQSYPGIQSEMTPVPDCGEETYQGSNKLTDKKALVTGGDSGIGRAAAIAYAKKARMLRLRTILMNKLMQKMLNKSLKKQGVKRYYFLEIYAMQHMRNKWSKMHIIS